jgi:hypothetical protein
VPILPIAVGAIIVIVIVVVLVARARRRGTPSHANPEAQSTADLDQTASSRLVQLDDAVRTSEQELGFAQAQFGEESTAGFRDALARAESLVAEAFAARREADAPDKGDSDEQRRALLLTIIARCDEADALLEAQEDAFDALRDVEQDLPAALASVRADLATAAGTVQTVSATVAQLSSDYSADEVSAVADAPEQLPRLVELAKSELAEAEAALTRGTSTEAAMEVRSAQLALAQITQTATAVERLSGELRDARSALAEQRSELESMLAKGPLSTDEDEQSHDEDDDGQGDEHYSSVLSAAGLDVPLDALERSELAVRAPAHSLPPLSLPAQREVQRAMASKDYASMEREMLALIAKIRADAALKEAQLLSEIKTQLKEQKQLQLRRSDLRLRAASSAGGAGGGGSALRGRGTGAPGRGLGALSRLGPSRRVSSAGRSEKSGSASQGRASLSKGRNPSSLLIPASIIAKLTGGGARGGGGGVADTGAHEQSPQSDQDEAEPGRRALVRPSRTASGMLELVIVEDGQVLPLFKKALSSYEVERARSVFHKWDLDGVCARACTRAARPFLAPPFCLRARAPLAKQSIESYARKLCELPRAILRSRGSDCTTFALCGLVLDRLSHDRVLCYAPPVRRVACLRRARRFGALSRTAATAAPPTPPHQDGEVVLSEFLYVMQLMGQRQGKPIAARTAEAMFQVADINRDGAIDFDEFLVMQARRQARERAVGSRSSSSSALAAATSRQSYGQCRGRLDESRHQSGCARAVALSESSGAPATSPGADGGIGGLLMADYLESEPAGEGIVDEDTFRWLLARLHENLKGEPIPESMQLELLMTADPTQVRCAAALGVICAMVLCALHTCALLALRVPSLPSPSGHPVLFRYPP